jgi:hypothetical protein
MTSVLLATITHPCAKAQALNAAIAPSQAGGVKRRVGSFWQARNEMPVGMDSRLCVQRVVNASVIASQPVDGG